MNSSDTASPQAWPTSSDAPTTGKTLVMTATYNEIDNLPRLVDEVFRAVPNVDFLVIDDNSPDGTGRWCDEQVVQQTDSLPAPQWKIGLGHRNYRGHEIRHRARL